MDKALQSTLEKLLSPDKVHVSVTRKVSDGNYGSFEVSMFATKQIDTGDDHTLVAAEMSRELTEQMDNEIRRWAGAQAVQPVAVPQTNGNPPTEDDPPPTNKKADDFGRWPGQILVSEHVSHVEVDGRGMLKFYGTYKGNPSKYPAKLKTIEGGTGGGIPGVKWEIYAEQLEDYVPEGLRPGERRLLVEPAILTFKVSEDGAKSEQSGKFSYWRNLSGVEPARKKAPAPQDKGANTLPLDGPGVKALLSISAGEIERDPKFKIANRKHKEKICASRMKAALQDSDDKRKRLMHWLYKQTSFTEVSDAQLQGTWVYLGSVQEFGVGVEPRIAKELGAAYDAALKESGFDDYEIEGSDEEEPEEVTA